MEQLVFHNSSYKIWRSDIESLKELSSFVVVENVKHHNGQEHAEQINTEIDAIYQEELTYAKNSIIYIVKDNSQKIIGSIRVFKWNRKDELPIQKIFGINPLQVVHHENKYSYWHIGRFAIDSFAGIPTMQLFKQLMVLAIQHIIKDTFSYMIAETDIKLLRIVNALGIKTTRLGISKVYLNSETIPICSSKKGLTDFYHRHDHLCGSS